MLLERTREDYRPSDEQWNRFKGNAGKLLRDWVGGGCICMTVYTEVSEMKVWVTTKLRAITIRGWGYMYLGIYRGG